MNICPKKVNNSVSTKIMGILNVTPDSFYDGGKYNLQEKAIAHGKKMAEEGADWIDVGGESTRPFSDPVNVEEEIRRVIPVIQELKKKLTTPLSIDTMKPQVAALACAAGVSMINDVSSFRDPEMIEVAKSYPHVDICVMHMLGTPKTMQENPYYEGGVVPYLQEWFSNKMNELVKKGISEERIILDPGVGFGKTVAHNVEIIENLKCFTSDGYRLLLGISRKSFMGKLLNKTAAELLDTTIVLNALAISAKVEIIRVHDVMEHKVMRETF